MLTKQSTERKSQPQMKKRETALLAGYLPFLRNYVVFFSASDSLLMTYIKIFMKRKPQKSCCKRFQECVAEESIVYCGEQDETEWAVPEFYHLYYCPFCGSFIKGRGWGEYEKHLGEKGH
jgi:hypothetical protein